jgi:hypothetical protein
MPGGADTPRYDVRVVLCDLDGVPISVLTQLAHQLSSQIRLNRPAQLTFQVPSDDPMVNLAHTDTYIDPSTGATVQYPYLSEGNRVIKIYRRDNAAAAGAPATGSDPYSGTPPWTLFNVYIVWHLDDEGDEDTATTTVTCVDGWQVLMHRAVIDNPATYGSTVFMSGRVDDVIKAMVDNTNSLVGQTGIVTTGTFSAPTSVSAQYDEAFIGIAIAQFADMGICDIVLTPQNSITGDHWVLSVLGAAGDYKPNAVFAWDMANRSVQKISRTGDMETVANDGYMFGGSSTPTTVGMTIVNIFGLSAHWADSGSQTRYRFLQDQPVHNEILDAGLLTRLANEEGALRAAPRQLIKIVPNPDKAPIYKGPGNHTGDFSLGDTVQVYATKRLRKAINGVTRVYGLDWGRDDDGFELISSIICSQDA